MRGRWAPSVVLVGLASMQGAAPAQPRPRDGAGAARLVTLAVSTETDEDVTQIVAYLRPLLEMRGFVLAVQRVDSLPSPAEPLRSAPQPGLRARVWLDLRTPSEAQVLFAAGDQPATARRPVATAGRIDQVAAAEIAEIILAALLAPEGALAAATPSGERAAQLAAMPAPAHQRGTWQGSVGILGAAKSWADNAVAVPEVGLSVLLEWRPAAATWSRALWSTVRYRPPFGPAQGPLGARVRGGEGDVLVVLARRVGGGSLGLAAGVGVDARFADATPPAGTALVNQQSSRDLAVFLRTGLRFDLRLTGPLSLFAAPTLDLFPLQGRLLVRQSGAARPIFTPWPLRPGVLAGASFAF